MRVTAKKRGFFGGIYYHPGDPRVFEVTEKQFSSIWMEKHDGRKKKAAKVSSDKKAKPSIYDGYVPLEIPSLM